MKTKIVEQKSEKKEEINRDVPVTGKIFTNKKHGSVKIQLFDFKRPSKFSKDQFRILEMIYNSFARVIETNLSVELRTLTEIRLTSIEQKTFSEYIESLPELCYINILSSNAFKGDTILQFDNKLIFITLDRLLGGKGEEIPGREFTDIEKSILQGVINEFLNSLREAWANIVDLNLKVRNEETNPAFVRVIALSEMCAVIIFEMKIGNKTGTFSFCLPFVAIESVLGKLTTRRWFSENEDLKATDNKKYIIENLQEVKLVSKVILGEVEINLNDLNTMSAGDVIKLNKKINNNLDLTIEEHNIFEAQIGRVGRNLVVQIVGLNSKTERGTKVE